MSRFSLAQLRAIHAKYKNQRSEKRKSRKSPDQIIAEQMALIQKSGLVPNPTKKLTAKEFAKEVMLHGRIEGEARLAAQRVHEQYKTRDRLASLGLPVALINQMAPVKFHYDPRDEITSLNTNFSGLLKKAANIVEYDKELEYIDALEKDKRLPDQFTKILKDHYTEKLRKETYVPEKEVVKENIEALAVQPSDADALRQEGRHELADLVESQKLDAEQGEPGLSSGNKHYQVKDPLRKHLKQMKRRRRRAWED